MVLVRLLASLASSPASVVVKVFFLGLLLDLFDDLLDGEAAAAGRRRPAVDDDALNRRQPRRHRPVRRRPDVGRSRRFRRRRRRRCHRFLRRRRVRRTRSDASERHAVLLRLVAPLAILSGLRDNVVVVVERDADETLLAGYVTTLSVSVDEPGLLLLPLAVAEVLPLLVDLAGVLAVEDGVEHDLWVVAVGVGPGAEALGVG